MTQTTWKVFHLDNHNDCWMKLLGYYSSHWSEFNQKHSYAFDQVNHQIETNIPWPWLRTWFREAKVKFPKPITTSKFPTWRNDTPT